MDTDYQHILQNVTSSYYCKWGWPLIPESTIKVALTKRLKIEEKNHKTIQINFQLWYKCLCGARIMCCITVYISWFQHPLLRLCGQKLRICVRFHKNDNCFCGRGPKIYKSWQIPNPFNFLPPTPHLHPSSFIIRYSSHWFIGWLVVIQGWLVWFPMCC